MDEGMGTGIGEREIGARDKKDAKDGTDEEAAGMAWRKAKAKREQVGSRNVALDEGLGNEREIWVRDKAGMAWRGERTP